MNIQYQDESQQTLVGSIKSNYPSLDDSQLQALNSINRNQQTPKQIVHKIVYGDTLEGLSLTYDVSIRQLKQRNKLESDDIYYLKQIVIPDPRVDPTPTKQQAQFMKIQQFVQYMSVAQKSSKTARYYLSENNWVVEKAVVEYRRDLQWQKKNKIQSVPIAYYNPIQLMAKKKP